MGRKRPARPITRTSDVLDIQDYLKVFQAEGFDATI